jgi:hypothetical protein
VAGNWIAQAVSQHGVVVQSTTGGSGNMRWVLRVRGDSVEAVSSGRRMGSARRPHGLAGRHRGRSATAQHHERPLHGRQEQSGCDTGSAGGDDACTYPVDVPRPCTKTWLPSRCWSSLICPFVQRYRADPSFASVTRGSGCKGQVWLLFCERGTLR